MKMSIRKNYKHTLVAGYIGSITQAIVNNFAPLLFVTFQRDWNITLNQLAFISTYNFLIQLTVDFLSAKYVDKIGVRHCIVFAHASAAAGLAGLGILPFIFGNPYYGIIISITLYAIGGGLIEVLASPIIEACPTVNKEANMSFLHSFYCWGQVAVVLGSTLFFYVFGIENWRIASFFWAVIPALNGVYFSLVPIAFEKNENRPKEKITDILKNKTFLILAVMMICSGASEISISQWASAFAEESLGITKAAGDIAGPCLFALLMGISRLSYSKFSEKIPLEKYIFFCSVMCFGGYLLVSLSPVPFLSLLGCGVCGFAVGIMWPGTCSLAAKNQKTPSTVIFALLALAGDCGCSSGPLLVGTVSEKFGGNLKSGLLAGSVFPFIMIFAVVPLVKKIKAIQDKTNLQ